MFASDASAHVTGSVIDLDNREAPWIKRLMDEVGFDTSKMVFEDRSRNTRENAVFSKELMQPAEGETWVLVTSALHMPRSVGSIRAVGWPVVPWPVDYRTGPAQHLHFRAPWGFSEHFEALQTALHEWTGLIYYRMRGWTTELFPAR